MPADPTVAIARTRNKKRDAERVYRLVKKAVDLLGGMQQFVKPGQTVFIKPNQTLFLLADQGVTTEPWVVAALARLALEAGATRAQVGDMPGGGIAAKEAMASTGMDVAADDRYKPHPKVRHVAGHPVCDQIMSGLVEALDLKLPAMTLMNLQKFWTNFHSERKY